MLVIVSGRSVERHGGVQEPAQSCRLDDTHLLPEIGQVFAVGGGHQATHAEQVCEGGEGPFTDLREHTVFIITWRIIRPSKSNTDKLTCTWKIFTNVYIYFFSVFFLNLK